MEHINIFEISFPLRVRFGISSCTIPASSCAGLKFEKLASAIDFLQWTSSVDGRWLAELSSFFRERLRKVRSTTTPDLWLKNASWSFKDSSKTFRSSIVLRQTCRFFVLVLARCRRKGFEPEQFLQYIFGVPTAATSLVKLILIITFWGLFVNEVTWISWVTQEYLQFGPTLPWTWLIESQWTVTQPPDNPFYNIGNSPNHPWKLTHFEQLCSGIKKLVKPRMIRFRYSWWAVFRVKTLRLRQNCR